MLCLLDKFKVFTVIPWEISWPNWIEDIPHFKGLNVKIDDFNHKPDEILVNGKFLKFLLLIFFTVQYFEKSPWVFYL